MAAQIRLQGVSYSYPKGGSPAISNLNMEVADGTFLLLAGPSGSGKSTFLRLLNGLVPHFSGGDISGHVWVKGLDVIQAGPAKLSRVVGFVSQNPEAQALMDRVEPEIAFALENAGVPRQEMVKRVDEMLAMLSLSELRDRPLVTLSGGERQRVAIACALVLSPQILVLDEPTSQLDPESADDVLRALVMLNRELGLTVLVAEHRLERVLPYSDRVAIFEHGRLRAEGDTQQLLDLLEKPPPLIELAKQFGWMPLPKSIADARQHLLDTGGPQNDGHYDAMPLDGALFSEMTDGLRVASHMADVADEALLQARKISFAYGAGAAALVDVDLDVYAGRILAILGANGSGKSTLLKCLIGLLEPVSGDILLDRKSILERNTVDLAQAIAYLPQYPDDLLFADSVYDELAITLRNHEIEPDDRIETMLQDLDLASNAKAYPRDLSTGQRQRVALGAIMITHPRVLLLDEPTRGLDGRLKQQLAEKWQRWCGQGMAIVLVTHDVELAALVADDVLILEQGRVATYGRAREAFKAQKRYTPQIARIFPERNWLTAAEAIAGLAQQ